MRFPITIISILENILLIMLVVLAVAYVTVAGRKTIGSMQRRLGPNAVGYYYLLEANLNRLYTSLEWGLSSPPKPHAFVSLPLQSKIGFFGFLKDLNLKGQVNIFLTKFSIRNFWNNFSIQKILTKLRLRIPYFMCSLPFSFLVKSPIRDYLGLNGHTDPYMDLFIWFIINFILSYLFRKFYEMINKHKKSIILWIKLFMKSDNKWLMLNSLYKKSVIMLKSLLEKKMEENFFLDNKKLHLKTVNLKSLLPGATGLAGAAAASGESSNDNIPDNNPELTRFVQHYWYEGLTGGQSQETIRDNIVSRITRYILTSSGTLNDLPGVRAVGNEYITSYMRHSGANREEAIARFVANWVSDTINSVIEEECDGLGPNTAYVLDAIMASSVASIHMAAGASVDNAVREGLRIARIERIGRVERLTALATGATRPEAEERSDRVVEQLNDHEYTGRLTALAVRRLTREQQQQGYSDEQTMPILAGIYRGQGTIQERYATRAAWDAERRRAMDEIDRNKRGGSDSANPSNNGSSPEDLF